MKNSLFPLIAVFILGCSHYRQSDLIEGSWFQCLKDGTYQEFRIDDNNVIQFSTAFDDHISVFSSKIDESTLIVSGINVSVLNSIDTITVISESSNTIVLKNRFGEKKLTRLSEGISNIDSTNIDRWKSQSLIHFYNRASLTNCLDLRTEEEKKPLVDLDEIEDDFEELVEINEMPNWALPIWKKHTSNFKRLNRLTPNLIEADFTGDGIKDLAVFVMNISNNYQGIMFFVGEKEKVFLAGAGNSFGPGGNDYEWCDSWRLFSDKDTYEMTFLPNGDIEGKSKVILPNPAISIREEEGSGGLIYFDGIEFNWLHQGD